MFIGCIVLHLDPMRCDVKRSSLVSAFLSSACLPGLSPLPYAPFRFYFFNKRIHVHPDFKSTGFLRCIHTVQWDSRLLKKVRPKKIGAGRAQFPGHLLDTHTVRALGQHVNYTAQVLHKLL